MPILYSAIVSGACSSLDYGEQHVGDGARAGWGLLGDDDKQDHCYRLQATLQPSHALRLLVVDVLLLFPMDFQSGHSAFQLVGMGVTLEQGMQPLRQV